MNDVLVWATIFSLIAAIVVMWVQWVVYIDLRRSSARSDRWASIYEAAWRTAERESADWERRAEETSRLYKEAVREWGEASALAGHLENTALPRLRATAVAALRVVIAERDAARAEAARLGAQAGDFFRTMDALSVENAVLKADLGKIRGICKERGK